MSSSKPNLSLPTLSISRSLKPICSFNTKFIKQNPSPKATSKGILILPNSYKLHRAVSSVIAKSFGSIGSGSSVQPSFPKWYDVNAQCECHMEVPRHLLENCIAFKKKVQELLKDGKLRF
ncbi:hypothetical protein PTKIN_Ptkin07bG0090500 [Pterospermum kingtungense]